MGTCSIHSDIYLWVLGIYLIFSLRRTLQHWQSDTMMQMADLTSKGCLMVTYIKAGAPLSCTLTGLEIELSSAK